MNEREDRPTSSPAYTLPSEDKVLHAIEAGDGAFLRYSGHRVCLPKGNWNDEQWAEFHRDWPHKPQEGFRREALAKLYGDQPIVTQVKAEALREAAECIVLREDHVGCPSCRVNAEAEAEVWLRDRAAAIECGAERG